jgi:hypothetical protein
MGMTFAREADLCSAFLALVPDGWLAYAETGGFDILLIRQEDGFQIGVQAKLRLNAKVLCQALEMGRVSAIAGPNPDCRAVLVPKGAVSADMARLCAHLGLTVIGLDPGSSDRFAPDLPRLKQDGEGRVWFEQGPSRRIPLPDLVPDVIAGAPAPRKLTAWKIKAMRIAVTLEREGRVVREDFKHHKMDGAADRGFRTSRPSIRKTGAKSLRPATRGAGQPPSAPHRSKRPSALLETPTGQPAAAWERRPPSLAEPQPLRIATSGNPSVSKHAGSRQLAIRAADFRTTGNPSRPTVQWMSQAKSGGQTRRAL